MKVRSVTGRVKTGPDCAAAGANPQRVRRGRLQTFCDVSDRGALFR